MRIIRIIAILAMCSVAAVAQQHLKAGTAAPDFIAQTLDGKQISLSELSGKVVVMTFWSTKCAICHAEIPKLNQIAARYRDQGVVFLALSMESAAKIEGYLRKNPFDFKIVPNSFGVV